MTQHKSPSKKKSSKKTTPGAHDKTAPPPIKETIQAPYHFTPEETGAMNADLRATLQLIDNLTDQKKQSAADFKLRIDNAQNSIKQLRLKLDSGQETRALEAHVTFDTKRGKKEFHHPITRAFIREEDMSPADWQLPMFKPEEIASPKPPKPPAVQATGDGPGKPPASGTPGETNVGNALDQAALAKEAPPLAIELQWAATLNSSELTRAFRAAAKLANWDKVQISAFKDRLHECATVAAMIETLRPHVAGAIKDATDL